MSGGPVAGYNVEIEIEDEAGSLGGVVIRKQENSPGPISPQTG
jgi:hypothetical protein